MKIKNLISNLTPRQLVDLLKEGRENIPYSNVSYDSITNVVNLGGGFYQFKISSIQDASYITSGRDIHSVDVLVDICLVQVKAEGNEIYFVMWSQNEERI